jgi:hypothetical protein
MSVLYGIPAVSEAPTCGITSGYCAARSMKSVPGMLA